MSPQPQFYEMVMVEAKCIKCGRTFLRGIYPQRTCDMCSESYSWELKKELRTIEKIYPRGAENNEKDM